MRMLHRKEGDDIVGKGGIADNRTGREDKKGRGRGKG